MSLSDFSGRLFAPVMVRPRRPLSNNASTDSCNMRFSFRTIMSGARSSIKRFSRLLRLITRRYRSFRSEVAKRPPSRGTKGRNSGGMTGMTSRIIHSGRAPDSMNDSTSFRRFTYFLRLASEPVSRMSTRSSSRSCSRSISASIFFRASAPIIASKASSPYSSWASIKSSSERSWPSSSGDKPGSVTM